MIKRMLVGDSSGWLLLVVAAMEGGAKSGEDYVVGSAG